MFRLIATHGKGTGQTRWFDRYLDARQFAQRYIDEISADSVVTIQKGRQGKLLFAYANGKIDIGK